MGYETYVNGEIEIPDTTKDQILMAVNLFPPRKEKHAYPMEDFVTDVVSVSDNCIEFQESLKNYHDDVEYFCALIAKAFPEAVGTVNGAGEEHEDFWRVVIEGGKAHFHMGVISYDDKGPIDLDKDW